MAGFQAKDSPQKASGSKGSDSRMAHVPPVAFQGSSTMLFDFDVILWSWHWFVDKRSLHEGFRHGIWGNM